MATLTANAITDILAGMSLVDPSLQVTAIHSIQQPHSTNVKYRLQLSDGMHTHPTLLPDQMNSLVLEEALVTGSILCLTEYSCKIFDKYTAIIILSFDIISNNAAIIGSPTPLLQAIAYLPSNSSEDPLNPFPIIPIKTLTPYHKQWSIQGRALAKTPIHNFKNVGRDGKVFGFDFVDMLGSEIHVVNKKKCKKKVVQSSPNTFQCPKCSTDLSECDFSYMLKMDLQDETGELLKVTAFEGPSNTLLGVPAKDFQLLLAEPNAVEPILSNVIDCKFFFDLNIKMVPFAGQETQSIVITAIKPT
ncbi:replication protein A 70 kDa DNA-binding subunit A-like [Cryptomeria japonica]|uniref:replication protein A 70 kDa DNA-binding subunit A-like n=1 Tax=Cryptomeria japonica TaxID=3369 RepID=UPI0025ABAC11|nr:replication protein A 70 kDa DNA-binding subunit A-like [Cryptomeria japonica]